MQNEVFDPTLRLLPWEATLNTREMGGYALRGGKRTRWKALVRSENLNLLTAKGQQALIDYGVRTVIDLRFHNELDRWPNPLANLAGSGAVAYVHNPLDQDQDMIWSEGVEPAAAMSDLYIRLLETNRFYIARALTAMAYASPGGVIFHCHAGKDRTGLVAAMILGALGASSELIIADYAFSTPAMEERALRELAGPSIPDGKRAYYNVLFTALPETMRRTLAYLKKTYGGLEGFLMTTTLKSKDFAALRERYTEPRI